MKRQKRSSGLRTSWYRDQRAAIERYAKTCGVPPPTNEELAIGNLNANTFVAHRADTGHYPDLRTLNWECRACRLGLTAAEMEDARRTVDTGSFLHPQPLFDTVERHAADEATKLLGPPEDEYRDTGSLEKLHHEMAELTTRMQNVCQRIANATLALRGN